MSETTFFTYKESCFLKSGFPSSKWFLVAFLYITYLFFKRQMEWPKS
jgi:hypothetical protein